MSTVSQLPTAQDIDVFAGADAAVTVNLGINISSYSMVAYATNGAVSRTIPLTVVSASTGVVALSLSSILTAEMISGSWSWWMAGRVASAVDPPFATVTMRWGKVRAASALNVPSDSALYLAVEMVAGDEYTFTVSTNTNLTGYSLSAYASDGVENTSLIPASIVSAAAGTVRVTIDEDVSFSLINGGVWYLFGFSPGGSNVALKAGPVRCYSPATPTGASQPIGASAVSSAPTPPQLGSIFL